MYKQLFNEEKQNQMRSFFLNTLAPLGKEVHIEKGQAFDNISETQVGIVTSGKVTQGLYHSSGGEKLLFYLIPGEIFNETSYFVQGEFILLTRAMEDSRISIIDKQTLDEYLALNPEGYRFFIHSITRKYRISLSQMSDILFTSSKTKIANTLYRLAIQGVNPKVDGRVMLDVPFTHEELSNLIGCSRVTVTKTLNELKEEGIIAISKRKIIINDLFKLENMVDF